MNHKDLEVWKTSIELVTLVYKLSDLLPKSEDFGLKSQMRRSAVSISANIAEGAARNHQKEFIQFCYISLGSLVELETLIVISNNIYQISSNEIDDLIIKERRLLLSFIKHLKNSTPNS
jgi:four helix bundle protein